MNNPYDPVEHGFDRSHIKRFHGIAFEDGEATMGNCHHPGVLELWKTMPWKKLDAEYLGKLRSKEAHDFLAYLIDEGDGRFPFARQWWIHMGPELGMVVWEDIDCGGFENAGRWAVLRWIDPGALKWVEDNWGRPSPRPAPPLEDQMEMDDLLAGLDDA